MAIAFYVCGGGKRQIESDALTGPGLCDALFGPVYTVISLIVLLARL